jgi:AcrR family transcriptional regulator
MRRFERARKPEEKELRRRAILTAARELAREVGPIELGLNELGRRSGVSKPNIYRYFESREEVLLRLFIAELTDVVAEIEEWLLTCENDLRGVSLCLTRAYLSRKLFCQLLGMVSSILEHNLSPEVIASCKTEVQALSAKISAALRLALPWLSVTDANWAEHSIALYASGLWPAANPSKNAAEVLARPEFQAMKPNAAKDLGRFIEVLLLGLQMQSKDRSV